MCHYVEAACEPSMYLSGDKKEVVISLGGVVEDESVSFSLQRTL